MGFKVWELGVGGWGLGVGGWGLGAFLGSGVWGLGWRVRHLGVENLRVDVESLIRVWGLENRPMRPPARSVSLSNVSVIAARCDAITADVSVGGSV